MMLSILKYSIFTLHVWFKLKLRKLEGRENSHQHEFSVKELNNQPILKYLIADPSEGKKKKPFLNSVWGNWVWTEPGFVWAHSAMLSVG